MRMPGHGDPAADWPTSAAGSCKEPPRRSGCSQSPTRALVSLTFWSIRTLAGALGISCRPACPVRDDGDLNVELDAALGRWSG
jgi:hypothetical protein